MLAQPDTGPFTIGGGNHTITGGPEESLSPEALIKQTFTTSDGAVYMGVIVRYFDVFGDKQRTTKYLGYVSIPDIQSLVEGGDPALFTAAKQHNSAD